MNLSDAFYVALCVTVLILGAVYWFWTQNQYLMRKINLLENIVYEMRAMNAVPPPDIGAPSISVPSNHAPAPSQDEDDLLHESLAAAMAVPASDEGIDNFSTIDAVEPATVHAPTPTPAHVPFDAPAPTPYDDDLQPGGIGSGFVETASQTSALEGMTLKELRRLAEQKNIAGAKTLKKNELITALREAHTEPIKPFEMGAATIELS
jgi:hypothetical protein